MTPRDPLEEQLSGAPYLPDDGFTERVMASLPPQRRDPRPLVLGLSGLAAAALGAWLLPGGLQSAREAAAQLPPSLGISPALLLAGLCTLGALAYAAARLLEDRA